MNGLLKYTFIFSACYLFTSVPALRADENSLILKKLAQMEAEIAELKAELKEQKKIHGDTAQISTTVSQAAVELPQASPTPGDVDESLFRPQPSATASAPLQQASSTYTPDLGQFGITYRSNGYKFDTLRFGAYGESLFGGVDSGKGFNNGFDVKRMVLLGTYQITEDIIFNTEIEFEHGGFAAESDDKLGGAIEVEQVFIDFIANDYLTWRSPGVDVVPVGYINLFHEPTQFYSAKRPELYNGLIPATWAAPSTAVYGKIIDGLNYQFQVSSALEDAGTTAQDDAGQVAAGGYEAGISGSDALKHARAPIGDRSQLSDSLGYTGRLSYSPAAISGLSGSTSLYYTNDTTVRGAYGTNSDGTTRTLGASSLSLFDTEVRYRIPKSNLELRAEYARVDFGESSNLRANNDGDAFNNVGSNMNGYSFEAAYHVDLRPKSKDRWEFVPFYRYSAIDLQTSGFRGSDENTPNGTGSKEYHTFGAALFPTPKIVIKADYQFILDDDQQSAKEKALLGAVGFFF